MRRSALPALVLVALAAAAPVSAQPPGDEAAQRALVTALRAALPFPEARPDGTPVDGGVDAVWTVLWPDPGAGTVEVLANPLNAANRERALAVEKAIQQSAMRSQRRSQGDYEQALEDFQRTGRVSGIREISLDDDGVAGARYDAESHLVVSVRSLDDTLSFDVATAVAPEVVTGVTGPAVVIRVPANVYKEEADPGAPPDEQFCADQAWLVFGAAGPASMAPGDGVPRVGVTVPVAPGRGGAVVSISGNPALVEQALREADWSVLQAVLGG